MKVSRHKQVYNLDTAKSVGIIFNATKQSSFDAAKELAEYISKKQADVFALGFVDSKEILNYYSDRSGFDFFSRKNLNWYGKPNNPVTEKFINRETDILIDLSLENFFPIQYIVGLSKARFKSGRFIEGDSYYDLMIDIRKNNELSSFIKHLKHYLSTINNI